MRVNPAVRLASITVAILIALTVLHKKPWQVSEATAGTLDVGFLPVTCHLTCPVTDFATKSTTTGPASTRSGSPSSRR